MPAAVQDSCSVGEWDSYTWCREREAGVTANTFHNGLQWIDNESQVPVRKSEMTITLGTSITSSRSMAAAAAAVTKVTDVYHYLATSNGNNCYSTTISANQDSWSTISYVFLIVSKCITKWQAYEVSYSSWQKIIDWKLLHQTLISDFSLFKYLIEESGGLS